MLASCATTHEQTFKPESTQLHNAKLPDFSGHWEKNYQASDVFMNKYALYVSDIRRTLSGGNNEANGRVIGRNGQAINDLAKLAQKLTNMPLLNIKQDEAGINVAREGEDKVSSGIKLFNLRCLYQEKQSVVSINSFGTNECGWVNNMQQMQFKMNMSGVLKVIHKLSLNADSSQLNVTTTISSTSVTSPIVISNYYTRFTSQDDNYDCKQTLTRNKVCLQKGHNR